VGTEPSVAVDRSKFKAVNRTTEGRELLPAQARITDPGVGTIQTPALMLTEWPVLI
jgi:hypothetical protein